MLAFNQNQIPHIFRDTSGYYGVNSSEGIFWVWRLHGRRKYSHVTFQKKYLVFAESLVDPWLVCLRVF